jgi:hypothetical protein
MPWEWAKDGHVKQMANRGSMWILRIDWNFLNRLLNIAVVGGSVCKSYAILVERRSDIFAVCP